MTVPYLPVRSLVARRWPRRARRGRCAPVPARRRCASCAGRSCGARRAPAAIRGAQALTVACARPRAEPPTRDARAARRRPPPTSILSRYRVRIQMLQIVIVPRIVYIYIYIYIYIIIRPRVARRTPTTGRGTAVVCAAGTWQQARRCESTGTACCELRVRRPTWHWQRSRSAWYSAQRASATSGGAHVRRRRARRRTSAAAPAVA